MPPPVTQPCRELEGQAPVLLPLGVWSKVHILGECIAVQAGLLLPLSPPEHASGEAAGTSSPVFNSSSGSTRACITRCYAAGRLSDVHLDVQERM